VQVHDFNPGFGKEVSPVGSNGFGTRTFWTVAIDDSDVAVQFAAGKAEMRADNLSLADYGNLANATGANFQTAFDPAVVSFDVVWGRPITRRVSVPDGTLGNHYAGEYVENQVTVTWSGTNLETDFTFTSDPGTFATSFHDGGFAELGHERNGTFVGEDGEDGAGGAAALARATGALDRVFAALPWGLTDLAPPPGGGEGQAPATSRPETGFAGDTAKSATVVRAAHPQAADPATVMTALFTEAGRSGEGVFSR
jgi:hypothetical protein